MENNCETVQQSKQNNDSNPSASDCDFEEFQNFIKATTKREYSVCTDIGDFSFSTNPSKCSLKCLLIRWIEDEIIGNRWIIVNPYVFESTEEINVFLKCCVMYDNDYLARMDMIHLYGNMNHLHNSNDKLLRLQGLYQLYENISWMRGEKDQKISDSDYMELQNMIFDVLQNNSQWVQDNYNVLQETIHVLNEV